MLRRLTVRWSVPTLLLGIAVGLGIAPGLGSPLMPRPDDNPSPTRPGDRAVALIETSRQLARVAAEVTPSVVHIESKVESPEHGMVEETGSGVIVTSPKVSRLLHRHQPPRHGRRADLDQISIRLRDGRSFHPTRSGSIARPTWPS